MKTETATLELVGISFKERLEALKGRAVTIELPPYGVQVSAKLSLTALLSLLFTGKASIPITVLTHQLDAAGKATR
jgi:hypothetical protein